MDYFQVKPDVNDIRFILGQTPPTSSHIPKTDRAAEDFWSTIFEAEPSLIFLLSSFYEDGKGSNFFPVEPGKYVNYGQMSVTNKKADKLKYGTHYLLEVLPDNCSNAIFVNIIHCEDWGPRVTPKLKGFLSLLQQCREADVSPIFLHWKRVHTSFWL